MYAEHVKIWSTCTICFCAKTICYFALGSPRLSEFPSTNIKKYKSTHSVEQECIPVGCVPAARRPYAGVCFPGGCAWSGGGVPGLGGGVHGLGWGGVPGLGGGGVPGRGVVCLVWGGVWSGGGQCAWSEGVCQHAMRQTPLPTPVDRQTPVKILPWPNFVAASKYAGKRLKCLCF